MDHGYEADSLAELTRDHSKVLKTMRERRQKTKVILNWWKSGQLTTVINAFEMMKDLSLVVDVLGALLPAFADGQGVESLTSENINAVLYQC